MKREKTNEILSKTIRQNFPRKLAARFAFPSFSLFENDQWFPFVWISLRLDHPMDEKKRKGTNISAVTHTHTHTNWSPLSTFDACNIWHKKTLKRHWSNLHYTQFYYRRRRRSKKFTFFARLQSVTTSLASFLFYFFVFH